MYDRGSRERLTNPLNGLTSVNTIRQRAFRTSESDSVLDQNTGRCPWVACSRYPRTVSTPCAKQEATYRLRCHALTTCERTIKDGGIMATNLGRRLKNSCVTWLPKGLTKKRKEAIQVRTHKDSKSSSSNLSARKARHSHLLRTNSKQTLTGLFFLLQSFHISSLSLYTFAIPPQI